MKNKLLRYYGRNDLHFVTFSCYERRAFLGSLSAKETVVQTLREVRMRYQFGLVGYVLMPEHVHLLIGEPLKSDLSKVLQVVKQRVSRSIRNRRRRTWGGHCLSPLVWMMGVSCRDSGIGVFMTSMCIAWER
jgi:putative transposase